MNFKSLLIIYSIILLTAYLLLRVNCDKIMHTRWDFDGQMHKPERLSTLDKHQNWNESMNVCVCVGGGVVIKGIRLWSILIWEGPRRAPCPRNLNVLATPLDETLFLLWHAVLFTKSGLDRNSCAYITFKFQHFQITWIMTRLYPLKFIINDQPH